MYQIRFSDSALKDLKKLGKRACKLIIHWIEKNLVNCIDPRLQGKALTGNLKCFGNFVLEIIGCLQKFTMIF